MPRIAEIFARTKAENRAAFIPFIMGGDPDLPRCAALLDALATNGADIIELGIPFSDPMADGPVIAQAGLRALDAGATLTGILELAGDFRTRHTTPLVLMGYLNPISAYGYGRFAADAARAGVDGVIIVDLPPEEAAELEPTLTAHGIALVRLIAPTSVPDRLELLTQGARGYLYYIAITGITGAGGAAPLERIGEHVAAISRATNLPVCVGFGIKTVADVAAIAPLADGVVVGSSLVRLIAQSDGDAAALGAEVTRLRAGCIKSAFG